MQCIRWITFGLSTAVAETLVHFFPSAGNVSAPYPALCKIRAFSDGDTIGEVTLEGARLSHPDGLRILPISIRKESLLRPRD